jgi:hypothetical protein
MVFDNALMGLAGGMTFIENWIMVFSKRLL